MKGFNIAPTPASGAPLAPVAEFIANLQVEPEISQHHELFGSTISGILGSCQTLPKKSNNLYRSLYGSSGQTPFAPPSNPGTPSSSSHKSVSKLTPKFHASKSGSGRKRRWGTLIDAAKSGKVSKLINRSRSEDSVCNSRPYRSSTGAGSDENVSESDSNPSLADAFGSGLSAFGFGQSGPLSVLRRKRKKSSSRMKEADESKTAGLNTISGGRPRSEAFSSEKLLKRASSVPARNSDPRGVRFTQTTPEEMEKERCSTEEPANAEEKEAARPSDAEPSPGRAFKSRNGTAVLSNLPGIQPVSGHNISHGWL